MTPGPSPGEARRIVWLSSAVHALVHAEMLVFAVVLLPLARELRLTLGEIGIVGTLSYACFGAGAPLAGWLADRFGPARVLAACCLGSAAALAALVVGRGTAALAAAFIGLGAAASLYHPAGLGLLSLRVRPLGPGLAVHGMAGNAGLAATPLAAGALAQALGWRAPYAALAVLALPLGLLMLGLDRGDRPQPAPETPPSSGAGPRRRLALLLALGALLGLVYRGSMTFMPTHVLERLGGDPEHALARAGLVTSVALAGGMLGQYAGGRALGTRPAESLLVGVLAAAVPLLAAVSALRGPLLPVVLFAFLLIHFAHQPLTNALLAAYSRPAVRSRVYGVSFALSFGVGGLAAAAGGFVAERYGTGGVFAGLAALAAAACLLGMALRRAARTPMVGPGVPVWPT